MTSSDFLAATSSLSWIMVYMKACRVEFSLLFLCLALEFLMSVTMWLKSCEGRRQKKKKNH